MTFDTTGMPSDRAQQTDSGTSVKQGSVRVPNWRTTDPASPPNPIPAVWN